ncbi:MAG: prephenate dehydratase [Muribaculaceae bacterium]|nr:prephenate dehydratase [Muribaculaceae bacterium]
MELNVTIQGVAGCFHDAAAREFFSIHAPHINVEPLPCETFPAMFHALEADRQLVGIMAIENTIAGALLQNHELLRQSDLKIIGEHKKRISHSIAALPEETLESVQAVMSHPMALMQCDLFLGEHPHIKSVEWFDTAGAARDIAEGQLPHRAAICPALAAELYGLNILEKEIETNKRNFTRFLVLAHEERIPTLLLPKERINKASVVFSLPHSQGALSKILTILSFYDMNLTKIQSMPILGREWEYRFYVDLTFDSQERYHQAITAIRPLLGEFKSLGEYAECQQEI